MGIESDSQDGMPSHVSVLVVGGGISGIGAACALQDDCADLSFLVVDAFADFGGTWHLHRYPGARSDSDLFTYGFSFKPWEGAPIASRDEILSYLGEVIDERDLRKHFRFSTRVTGANWNSKKCQWEIDGVRGAEASHFRITCDFLWMCQGYYRHSEGHTPDWPNMDQFDGQIVHPQHWPEDLDYEGRRVLVIGSGATAATLVPALAPKCEHVTMLQRSPTYFSPQPNRRPLAETLRQLDIDKTIVHDIQRRQILSEQEAMLKLSLSAPDRVAKEFLKEVAKFLPQEQVDAHFTPKYKPWQQRVAVVPDGDLFKSVQAGEATIVTDQIECFVPNGVRLISGLEIDADIIITATGFDLTVLGEIPFSIDGKLTDMTQCINYKGMMYSGLPNLAYTVGYFRVWSWTLRVELISQFVCRLLNYMKQIGATRVEPKLRPYEIGQSLMPSMNAEVFNAGYILRSIGKMPHAGPNSDWHGSDYPQEKSSIALLPLDNGILTFEDHQGHPVEVQVNAPES